MRTCKFIALFLAAVGLMAGSAWSRPVDLSAPNGELGAADPMGYLGIWRTIDGIGLQLDPDSYLPLRYKFSTDPKVGGMLGTGFYVPIFEARNALYKEDSMRASLPCGKALYLWRSTVDNTKFATPDKEWAGTLNGDDFTMTRDDGWSLLYRQGRLTSITTDDKHTFTWSYEAGGAANVSEDGHLLLSVEPNAAGLVKAFVSGGKRCEIDYANRPITQVLAGQTVIKELDPALSSFKYPDGKTDVFQFVLTPELVPTLTYTDRDAQQSVYTWNAKNNYLATEKGPRGDWTYKVGETRDESGAPPLSRTGGDGTTEGVTIDTKHGTYTQTGTDGVTTVTQIFETAGPLYHKVKSIERVSGKTTTQVYHASYDEAGKLLREVGEDGFITSFTYGTDGKVSGKQILPPSDPEHLTAFQAAEKALLEKVAQAAGREARNNALQDLAFLYLDKTGDPTKALALVPKLTDQQEIFNIRMQSVLRNKNLTNPQKTEQLKELLRSYPDQKNFLTNLITIYGAEPISKT